MHLTNGQQFPTMTASRVGGGEMTIPQNLEGPWAILLFYRGHWCPYCQQQLTNFQRAQEQLKDRGAEVVAFSVDCLEQAQQTIERHKLTFPVLYGLDAHQVAEQIGAYTNDHSPCLQATGFVLHPDGTVVLAVYSSGAIGRLVAADTINFIKYLQQQAHEKASEKQGSMGYPQSNVAFMVTML